MELLLENAKIMASQLWQQLLLPMDVIAAQSAPLRQLTFPSVVIRLTMAILLGGALGLERGRKKRPAGFRTYMLVCTGAALTMLLGQYMTILAQAEGLQTDMTRIGAQVINGIGFLGAGTILVTEKQQVKGLTTAAGLWASACMGLALGAGFYECVLLAFLLIGTVVMLLPKIEMLLVEKSRNMNIYVEVSQSGGIHQVIEWLKNQNMHIYNVDISHPIDTVKLPNAIFSFRPNKGMTHTKIIEQLSHLECIRSIEEL